jgi:two-component system chemotaxis response regulator CheY
MELSIFKHHMKILVVDDEADVQPLFLQRFRKEIRSHEVEFDFAHRAKKR